MSNSKKIFFYDAKPYDQQFFDEVNKIFGFEIQYSNAHLNNETVSLAKGFDVVCVFLNDVVNKKVIETLKRNRV